MPYYNTEKKLSYIRTLDKNKDRAIYVLQSVAKVESQYKKDLSQFTKS